MQCSDVLNLRTEGRNMGKYVYYAICNLLCHLDTPLIYIKTACSCHSVDVFFSGMLWLMRIPPASSSTSPSFSNYGRLLMMSLESQPRPGGGRRWRSDGDDCNNSSSLDKVKEPPVGK